MEFIINFWSNEMVKLVFEKFDSETDRTQQIV